MSDFNQGSHYDAHHVIKKGVTVDCKDKAIICLYKIDIPHGADSGFSGSACGLEGCKIVGAKKCFGSTLNGFFRQWDWDVEMGVPKKCAGMAFVVNAVGI